MSYMEMLADGHIFWQLERRFRKHGFIWQQDNAPIHGPGGEVIRQQFNMLIWPAHSPDLSPIEMIWSIIKRKLRGMRFANADELFSAVEQALASIPQSEIDNLVSSFLARCQVCVNWNGAALNGHWREVHELHH
jgi:transposase